MKKYLLKPSQTKKIMNFIHEEVKGTGRYNEFYPIRIRFAVDYVQEVKGGKE